MDHDEVLERLEIELRAVSRLVAQASSTPGAWDVALSACPGWAVRDLVGHLGFVHRWVANAIETGRPDLEPKPLDADEQLSAWFDEGVGLLAGTLRRDPGEPAWTLAEPRTVGFWRRRQLHENTVHRWDLATAIGADATIDAEVALDGIDEVIGTMLPRQVKRERVALPEGAIRLVADPDPHTEDGAPSWLIGTGAPVATGHAEPVELYLALWHRLPAGAVALRWDGDVEAGRAVLALPLAP
ncbi:MAG TPA: maleylpyruvate isomerase family mycothiol-dependent enzyme [Dermatophilaceae bacterium]|nr:maleylpyruvate isomerase family mycothiol-dependent enzyme [Dermatophilaceae bacterium]